MDHIIFNDDPKQTYVGESKLPLSVRCKEHIKLGRPTGVGEHCLNTGQSVSITNTKILERKLDWHPSKHETLTQCCFNVGPTSETAGRRRRRRANIQTTLDHSIVFAGIDAWPTKPNYEQRPRLPSTTHL